ncbi:MAG: hypothetical protein JWM11_2695, partial [Planctomycetaceae bacterium]|nr:hypothetical protein [Planctomycetaceae bacterium]
MNHDKWPLPESISCDSKDRRINNCRKLPTAFQVIDGQECPSYGT